VEIASELNNLYQHFHSFDINLLTNNITLKNWALAHSQNENLIANFDSNHFVTGAEDDKEQAIGKVNQIYSILDDTNSLTYYLTEELNDPNTGWNDFDTIIMKMSLANPEALNYIRADFYYGLNQYIGNITIYPDQIDSSGVAYIPLPDSSAFSNFKVSQDARIVFTPVFYSSEELGGNYYTYGYPTVQAIEWNSEAVENGFVNLDLEKNVFSEEQSVVVLNSQYEFLYEITDVELRKEVQNPYDNQQNYELIYSNINLPELFTDAQNNSLLMRDGDVMLLKYNSTFAKSVGLTIGEMALQKKNYIDNYEGGDKVPVAELNLLGVNVANNNFNYTKEEDLYYNRDKLVAFESRLDITPFESNYYNSLRTAVINVSFSEIYSDFKIIDNYNIENAYITDVLITCNDVKYELVVDSFYFLEFDANGTLFDSEVIDIFQPNHLEAFYVGNNSNIYNTSYIFNCTGNLPLYYNNSEINETIYFQVFDNLGNNYYVGEQLLSNNLSQGIYNLSWNPCYSMECYYDLLRANTTDEYWDLVDYYNPFARSFSCLYLEWADEIAWKDWHSIESPNINTSTVEICYDYYNTSIEEYQTIFYEQSLNEFEVRQVALEYIRPFTADNATWDFELSQDYSGATNLNILSIEGYNYKEENVSFNIFDSEILPDGKTIRITAPTGDFSKYQVIVVLVSFDEGANSDFTQFRMQNNAIVNHNESSLWTINDSFYISYEYKDLDYYVLLEDNEVGSDNSYFEYINYMRNSQYIVFQGEIYTIDYFNQETEHQPFTEIKDTSSVLELKDFDVNAEYEYIVEKMDVMGSGYYDSYKYASINPAGELNYHTLVQKISSTQIFTDKINDTQQTDIYDLNSDSFLGDVWDDLWRGYWILAKRTINVQTNVVNTIDKIGTLIQKDTTGDGTIDSELSIETVISTSSVRTHTTETTNIYWRPILGGETKEGYLIEESDSDSAHSEIEMSILLRNFNETGITSTRFYQDAFPNEITQRNNMKTFLETVLDAQNSDVISTGIILGNLLSLSHDQDNVPQIFDAKTTIQDGKIVSENILSSNETVIVPSTIGTNQEVTTLEIEAIKVEKSSADYLYLDSGDGIYETILSVEEGKVKGIGFDYDHDSRLNPDKSQLFRRYNLKRFEDADEGFDIEGLKTHSLVHYEDFEEGWFLEKTYSDSFFDISKTSMSSGSSVLLSEAAQMTADRFIETLTPMKVIGDVGQEILAQMIGVAGGVLAGASWGYFIAYAAYNVFRGWVQQAELDNFLRHDDFYGINFDDSITLSEKYWVDNSFFGDLPTNAIFGSGQGIYAEVKKRTNENEYIGQLVLSAHTEDKTYLFGSSYKNDVMDFSLQTRNYMCYSDLSDTRLEDFIILKRDPLTNKEVWHAQNSITHLENKINQTSNGQFNKIIFTNIEGVPQLTFADSLGDTPTPEFFEDRPIYISKEKLNSLSDSEKYHTIYKIFDASSSNLQLLPESSLHTIKTDIEEVKTYVVRKWYAMDGTYAHQYEEIGNAMNFTFNSETGVLTLDQDIVSELQDKIAYYEGRGYEAYACLEIKVEKFQTFEDETDISQEELRKIATMQSVQASLLEYTYQFNIGVNTQEKINELAYTLVITAISTAISMGITIGLGKLAKMAKNNLPDLSDIGNVGLTRGKKFVSRATNYLAKGGTGANGFIFTYSIISECFEEIFVDPFISSLASGIVGELGGNEYAKILASSLAESGRETALGPITNLFKGGQSNSKMLQSHYSQALDSTKQDKLEITEELKEQLREVTKPSFGQQLKGLAFSTFGLFSAAMIGVMTPGFLGPTLATGISTLLIYCRLNDISLRESFGRLIGKGSTPESSCEEIHNNKKFQWKKIRNIAALGALAIGGGIVGGAMFSLTTSQMPLMFSQMFAFFKSPIMSAIAGVGISSTIFTLGMNGMVGKIPNFLQNDAFLSILSEINEYLDTEEDLIISETEDMQEDDIIAYIREKVFNYLHQETNLLETLEESSLSKVAIYTSALGYLKFTEKSSTGIDRAISGITWNNIKFVIDLFKLQYNYKKDTYTLDLIRDLLYRVPVSGEGHYEIIYPLTQDQFEVLSGTPSVRRIKIKCPEGHEYTTTPGRIKNFLVAGKHSCGKCSALSRAYNYRIRMNQIPFTFQALSQVVSDRGDILLFPLTQQQWGDMEAQPSHRRIEVQCGRCGEIRGTQVWAYYKSERCLSCVHLDNTRSYDEVIEEGISAGFILKTSRNEFKKIQSSCSLDATKVWSKIELDWKCMDCNEKVSLSFRKIMDDKTGCPSCTMSLHQKHVHKYFEAMFKKPFYSEEKLKDVATKLKLKFSSNPLLRYDGFAIIRLPGMSIPIPVLFEARGFQYFHWPNYRHKGTQEGLLKWLHYRKNADERDRFARENKIVLISIMDRHSFIYSGFNPSDYADYVRSQLIEQFKLQSRICGYSKEGITLNPPLYDINIFRNKFLDRDQTNLFDF